MISDPITFVQAAYWKGPHNFSRYVPDLVPEYSCAKDLLYDLRELHDLREKVVGMDRSVISELQRYRTPPPVVLQVMTGVLTLLGEKQQKAAVSYLRSAPLPRDLRLSYYNQTYCTV